jgi:hypothetical protein
MLTKAIPGAMLLALIVYVTLWQITNKRALAREEERQSNLRAQGVVPSSEEKNGAEKFRD